MNNKGPVYNLNTGKLDFPLDDRVAIGTDGKISYRIGEHTAISPNPVVNNNPVNQWEQDIVSGRTHSRPAKKSAEPSKAVMTFLQGGRCAGGDRRDGCAVLLRHQVSECGYV